MLKRRKIVRIICLILLIIVDAVAVLLCVNELTEKGKLEILPILRTVAIIGASLISIIKMYAGQSRLKGTEYRAIYKKYIKDAFLTDKSQEKRFFKALDLYNEDKYSDCIKILDKLLCELPNNKDMFAVLFFKAKCYDDRGMYEPAIELYERALSIWEHSGVASNLGTCYDSVGNVQKAIDSYKKSISLDPNNPYPYNNIAQLAILEGEYEIALDYAYKAIELDANLNAARKGAAIALAMLGDNLGYREAMRGGRLTASDKRDVINYLANMGVDIENL
ncbi:MAG: tetratricopeptide repeat protein [Clostridia bacterium]|nr:tetratricopeptide repeat protein [Clostridia bacterium]